MKLRHSTLCLAFVAAAFPEFALGQFPTEWEYVAVGHGTGGSPNIRIYGRTQYNGAVTFNPLGGSGANLAVGNPDLVNHVEEVYGNTSGAPRVRVKISSIASPAIFSPYDATFINTADTPKGGVHVAVGDVDGDGVEEIITGPGPGYSPYVRVFSKSGISKSAGSYDFLAYDPAFSGGVRVACGDVNGDGNDDIVVSPGPGGDQMVKMYDGDSGDLIWSFHAEPLQNEVGLFVACGNVTGDARDEVIVGHQNWTPLGTSLDLLDPLAQTDEYLYVPAFGPTSRGTRVSTADVDGDGYDEILIGADTGGGSRVSVLDMQMADQNYYRDSFHAFSDPYQAGVNVAGARGDQGYRTVAAGGGASQVGSHHYTGFRLLTEFQPFGPTNLSGHHLAMGDLDDDGLTEVVVARAGGPPQVKVFSRSSLVGNFAESDSFTPVIFGYNGGLHVACGDVDGDGNGDVIVGTDDGTTAQVMAFRRGDDEPFLTTTPFEGDFLGGARVASGNVIPEDGFEATRKEIIVGSGPGRAPLVRVLDGTDGLILESWSPPFQGDTSGVWVASGDVNGDGIDDIIASNPNQLHNLVIRDVANGVTYLDNRIVPTAPVVGQVTAGDGDGDSLWEPLSLREVDGEPWLVQWSSRISRWPMIQSPIDFANEEGTGYAVAAWSPRPPSADITHFSTLPDGSVTLTVEAAKGRPYRVLLMPDLGRGVYPNYRTAVGDGTPQTWTFEGPGSHLRYFFQVFGD